MGNQHSKPQRRLKLLQPDEMASTSDSTMSIMENQHSRPQRRLNVHQQPDKMASTTGSGSTMSITKPHRQLPKIKFRVLVIGRANAGKTSILQRVCDTTDSPVIYRKTPNGRKQVRSPALDRKSVV